MRDEGEALRRRAAERASRVGAAVSTMDEAWAEASDPAEVGDADADADEAGAEDLAAVADGGEAGETPEEDGETTTDEAAGSEAGRPKVTRKTPRRRRRGARA